MNPQLLWVLGLLGGAVLLFALNKPRMDAVALLALVALPLTGVLDIQQTLDGFSDPNLVLIAALFVVGEGLVRTGIAYRLGDWLAARAGNSETRLIVLLMLAVAGLGSVMSSTGVVAIFIPVVLSVAARLRLSPARLMMPLAFAGLISGMLTLVATPPNLVVHADLRRHGLEGFGFFAPTLIGLPILVLGIGYMLLVRRWLLREEGDDISRPARPTLAELARDYRLSERERRLRVRADSPLVGQVLDELQLRQEHGINVIAVERERQFRTLLLMATGSTQLHAGDFLLVDLASPAIGLLGAYQALGLEPVPLPASYYGRHSHQLGLAEVVLPPESQLAGKTIQEIALRSSHHLNLVGLRRQGKAMEGVLVDEKLRAADTLLVAGDWKYIHRLQQQTRNFVVLGLPVEVDEVAPAISKAPHALLSLALMIGLMVSGVVPNVLAALIGCLLMGAFRCIDLDSAYRAIHWPTLILIAGMLPFAQALQQTGGVDLAVSGLVGLLGNAGPYAILACLFSLTAVIGLFVSNTATAVLMAPVAIATAQSLGMAPQPFAMIVALAASAAFMTPVSSPVNTLVMTPGRYRFGDFVRIGVPFTVLVMLVSVFLVPWFFPLTPK
ncbi:SLC13 family permease [Pseudomonas sp. Gutcm_11s]|uniref:SLC13 family permease n=1 Tax=Pseudomonas sp. Gutcm_11s TaxID=3026088 RepID=UPI0023616EC5|nr:SLC13 family permease [Pseudomonas sp. Gutcm_11s]MDD0841675.1 SLC13 family permease [Pseudomonas sp. Gutcm_11s]